MLNQLNERSFSCLTLIAAVICTFTPNVAARPVFNISTGLSFNNQHSPRNADTEASNNLADSVQSANASDVQTIVTSQIIPSPDGNTTEVCTFIFAPTTLPNGSESVAVEKNCSFTFTSNFPTATGQSTSTSTFITTVVQTSTTSPSPSISVSESSVPSITSVSIVSIITLVPAPNPIPQSTATSGSASPSFMSSPDHVSVPIETISSTVTSASSVSQSAFNSSGQGHLSTLPIFLGAFGGVAGIALLVVGCMVYHPLRRLNEWRLNPPSCFIRRRIKPWNHQMADFKGEPFSSAEKLTGDARNSQESKSSAQVSRWSRDSGGLTRMFSQNR